MSSPFEGGGPKSRAVRRTLRPDGVVTPPTPAAPAIAVATPPTPPKAAPRVLAPTPPPAFFCPFSGRPVEFRVCGPDHMIMVISPFGWTSKLFSTLAQAQEWASFVGGVQTWYRERIEVRERVEPSNDAQDAVDGLNPGEVTDDDLPPSLRKG